MHLFNLCTDKISVFLPVTSFTIFLLLYLKICIIWGRSFFWLPGLLVVIFSELLQNFKLCLLFRSVSRMVGNAVKVYVRLLVSSDPSMCRKALLLGTTESANVNSGIFQGSRPQLFCSVFPLKIKLLASVSLTFYHWWECLYSVCYMWFSVCRERKCVCCWR